MNNKLIRTILIMICLMLSVTLSACSDGNDGDVATVPTDNFEPAADTGKDGELYGRYEEYKEKSSLAFVNNEPTSYEAFSYVKNGDGVDITEYIGEENIIVVPDEIEGLPVKKITSGAFESAKTRAIYIPDSVVTIERGAISGCDNLSTLRVPFIGDGADNAFIGYIFGAGSYGENAVKVPASLDMLIVGDKADFVSDNALRGCKTLSAIVLSDSVGEIGKLAFYECADLVYVSLGRDVDKIGEYAFAYCSSLYYIDCSGVGEIETGAFYSCSSLNGIKYNMAEDDFLGRIFGATSIEYNGDFVPSSLRNVTVAEGCEVIPDMAFASCKYITSVALPESLESIGVRAFYGCRSLGAIIIPDGVKSIDDDAFFGCDTLVSVELGKSLESLGMQTFYGCKLLEEVSLPGALKEIKPSTFYGCTALKKVSLGGVKTVGKDAFGKCTSLSPVSLDGVTVAEGNDALSGTDEE